MSCPVTTVSLLPQLLVFSALAGAGMLGFLVDRARESLLESNPQGKQKSQGKSSRLAPASAVPAKPSVVTHEDGKFTKTPRRP